jgi:hypothetical protein
MITPITEAVVLELFKRKRSNALSGPSSTTASSAGVPSHYLKNSVAISARSSSFAVSALSLNPLLLNGETQHEQELENGARGYDNMAMQEKSVVYTGQPGNREPPQEFTIKDLTADELRIAKGLVLCVAYAANIGGKSSLEVTQVAFFNHKKNLGITSKVPDYV